MLLNYLIKTIFLFLTAATVLTIGGQHPIFSLGTLVLSFLFASLILFMIECEFLAFIFITIYVGAIAVLFLFSIMMLNFKKKDLHKNLIETLPIGFFLGSTLFFLIINNIYDFFPPISMVNFFYNEINLNWFDFSESQNDIKALGIVLYTQYLLHFLLTGIIMIVVLLGIICLSENSEKFSKKFKTQQLAFKQVSKQTKLN